MLPFLVTPCLVVAVQPCMERIPIKKKKKKKNVIVGCIYHHPSLNPTEFVDIHIQELLQKMSKEDKTIVLLGDFNIDLLKYDTNKDSTAFLDLMYTNFLLPYVTTPTRVTSHSETLSDNIFSNKLRMI